MSARGKRATIKDVAAFAGVSVTTVSFVLNGRGVSVPERTAERVRAAAETLGYRPDFAARSMVMRRTNLVGVLVPDISNGFFAEMVGQIQRALASCGYDVILCNGGESFENDLKYLKIFADRKTDGLILTPSEASLSDERRGEFLTALSEVDIPHVFLDRFPSAASSPCFAADNEESGFLMTRYLLDLGHERIGFLTGSLSSETSRLRLRGAERAFSERGLSLRREWVKSGGYDFLSGKKGAAELFETDVMAIFCFSDVQAYGVCAAAGERGLKIPSELSVAGFDDVFGSALFRPSLTTLRQPAEKIARAAAGALVRAMKGEDKIESTFFPAELIARESTAPLNG